MDFTAEGQRLEGADREGVPWRRWGPYLSDRQWGTVREDYSDDGDAWSYFTHDQARSRAYRWGEDGIAGVSDDQQHLCLSLALWNGADPILKERFFGLTNAEGNHGEDVKEYYFHLDNTPTHSYMRMLYKYPQAAYPYEDLVAPTGRARATNSSTSCSTPGCSPRTATSTSRWSTPRPIPTIWSRWSRSATGARPSAARRAGQLWFRNTWTWAATPGRPPLLADGRAGPDRGQPRPELGRRVLVGSTPAAECLFTENETNARAALRRPRTAPPYVKDGIDDYVVHGRADAVNPDPHRHQGGGPPPAGGARRRLGDRPLAAATGRRRAAARRGAWRRARRRGRPAPRGGRRVLPGDHPARRRRRRRHDHAAGAGRDAVEQAVLLLRPRPVAAGARGPPVARPQAR